MTYGNLRFQVWDLGGQENIRPYWRCYYQNTNAVVYVIDSSDTDRIELSRRQMLTMLEEEELRGVPLLIFANKQDMRTALPVAEVSERLGLTSLKDRQWSIFGSSAVKGEGIEDGMNW